MANVTIKILAKELGLSTAAISKALHDSHEISESTKQRVLALAKELNYIPNPYASSLRHRKSNTIAVVLPDVTDSFFSEAINGIESIAIEKDFHVLLYLTHERAQREETILKEFKSGRVDGIIMSISSETTNFDCIHDTFSKNMPIVFFDRICEQIDTAKIITNDFESGYLATRHLIEQGCKKITFLSNSDSLLITKNRKEGALKACLENAIEESFLHVKLDCYANEFDSEKIEQLLTSEQKPDGIVCCIEKFTPNVYIVCRKLGLSIPKDIKVLSFSNLNTAIILNPSLTTITQPAFEMGKAAATILIKSIEKKSFILKDETITLPSTLFIRDSTTN
ncbi:LacI family DNA-binding transcriptional regulator [Arachidicoccus soli]|uniref:LacI family transcriptional regulator n=1 Tax=Arachidicoccus soli TaxID=2341117 RepID=A0A386HP50_9BACT|nr:LacI family DNA-binding transcriptional regulator [Arachidicoccus soli]AYD47718.1 LacI family transcriptional regulator [Arachidicoccus soli]